MSGRKFLIASAALALVLSSAEASARPRSPKCYTVSGVLSLSADAGFLLHPDHGAALAIDPAPAWPKNLERAMDKAQKKTHAAGAFLDGDYTVCRLRGAVPDKPWLHHVYIRSASHLRLAPDSPRG